MSRAQTRSIGLAVVAGVVVAGAAALGASRSMGGEGVVHEPSVLAPQASTAADPGPNPQHEAGARPGGPARHPRFHDMYYVFTGTAPTRVAAYPLASPPGIVIDLEGVPEPEEPASTLVGEDDRIRSVRRRSTERGLRYIIAIETPVTRLEVEHEGEVVIVTPIR